MFVAHWPTVCRPNAPFMTIASPIVELGVSKMRHKLTFPGNLISHLDCSPRQFPSRKLLPLVRAGTHG